MEKGPGRVSPAAEFSEFRHESATINHLPNETLLTIFQHLQIKDVIRYRLVCKRFMLLCDEVRVAEVIISNKIENIRGRWFHTNRPFNYRDAVDLKTFNIVRPRLEKSLTRLLFQGDFSGYKQLKLNRFTHLEELRIESEITNSDDVTSEDVAIRLPNLKILDIYDYYTSRLLVLETPQLEVLKCYMIHWISLAHPDTITHLEVCGYLNGCHVEIASSLTNIQYLKVAERLPRSRDIVLDYPRLRTLVCNSFFSDYFSPRSVDCLSSFVEQKRILQRPDLRIYFQSVEISDAKKIDEHESAKSVLKFQMQNYDTLCDYVCSCPEYEFDYTELMEIFNGRSLPEDFFVKFRNIQVVKVSGGEVDQEHVLQFVKGLENLKELYLEDANLDQKFFDALPVVCSQLTTLDMRNTTTASYEFLFKMNLLEKFVIDHNSPEFFDLSLRLLKELKYFRDFGLAREIPQYHWFIRYYKDGYEFNRYQQGDHQYLTKGPIDYEHLVRLVNEHKNGTLVGKRKRTSDDSTL